MRLSKEYETRKKDSGPEKTGMEVDSRPRARCVAFQKRELRHSPVAEKPMHCLGFVQ